MRVIFGQAGMSQWAWTIGPNGVGLMAQVCLNNSTGNTHVCRTWRLPACTLGDNEKAFSESIELYVYTYRD